MNYVRIIAITFILIFSMSAELLIVKKIESGFAPLDTEETIKHGKQITDILFKYQWPMCIASELTQEEQDELLSPDIPYAEELFIENKIHALGKNFEQYSVIFIPAALYELFCIIQTYVIREQKTPLSAAQKILYSANRRTDPKWYIDLLPILNANNSANAARKAIYDIYKNINKQFFDSIPPNESSWFYINNKLASFLFDQYPTLKDSPNGLDLSNAIKQRSDELIKTCIQNLIFLPIFSKRDLSTTKTSVSMFYLPANLQDEAENNIITTTIALEYEARKLNKALLLRGTSFEEFQVGFGKEPKKTLLAGSTLVTKGQQVRSSFEKTYGEKRHIPYSISFGISLFSGILNDLIASPYYYLVGKGSRFPTEFYTHFNTAGYALFIDKQAYYQHQHQNLLFIPPLSILASLFQAGEYFHPRTKAAITLKDPKEIIYVKGLQTRTVLKDPSGVLLITRDPLKHAELFSKFLAENGRIIQKGNESSLTNEEKKFAESIKESQHEAAKFYKAVRTITPKIQHAIKKYKEKGSIAES